MREIWSLSNLIPHFAIASFLQWALYWLPNSSETVLVIRASATTVRWNRKVHETNFSERKKAFSLIYLNLIILSPREVPSTISGDNSRENRLQQWLCNRPPPVPRHKDQLYCNSASSRQQVQFLSRYHSSSISIWYCILLAKQLLGSNQLRLTFSCFSCFDSFSFSFFDFFFAITFPSTSSPFLFLREKK